MDASCYIRILIDHALNFLDLHEIVQQDNARQTVKKKQEFYEENAIVCLKNSPSVTISISLKIVVSSEKGV